MKQTILSMAAIAAAFALAGCGGSTNASGAGSGVAGAKHTKAAGSFRASVHGFEAQLQASVHKFKSGNIAGAAAGGGSLLTSCDSLVNGKLGPQARTQAQTSAVAHLRIACKDLSKATSAGASGNLKQAKRFANEAVEHAKIAARLSG
jgi:hypothetical protein